jgi:outer membrane protein assembly factor BamB
MLQSRRSCLFVMDITDPYQPALLWERLLPGGGSGHTRGIAVDRCVATRESAGCLYLTADFAGGDDAPGIHALALKLVTGELLWQFTAPNAASGMVAGVAVHGRVAIFGTGGVSGSDDSRQYAVYAVEIGPGESRLRWVYALAVGEKVWAPPLVDASDRLVLGMGVDYTSLAGTTEQATSGRVVALDGEGTEELSRETAAAVVGGLVSAPGVAVAVNLTGEVTLFGSDRRLTGPAGPTGSVRLLAWRER